MFFKNPFYLWALLGLIMPIAIHLWSNKKGKVVKIGSIKYLNETDAAQTNSIRLNEILLLILRLLIIVLISFLMAQPSWIVKGKNSSLTYVIEPSILQVKNLRNILEDAPADTEFRLLEKGMPIIDQGSLEDIDIKGIGSTNYWQLIDELEALNTDSLVVLVSGRLSGLKGKRPIVGTNGSWIVIDNQNSYTKDIAIVGNTDKTELIGMEMDHANLKIRKRPLAKSEIEFSSADDHDSVLIGGEEEKTRLPYFETKPYFVLIDASVEFEDQSRYFEKAFISISKFLDHPIQIKFKQDEFDDNQFPDLVVNLGKESAGQDSIKSISYRSSIISDRMLLENKKGLKYTLGRKLTAQSIVDEHLLEQLIEIMDLRPKVDQLIEVNDTRIASSEEISPIFKESESSKSLSRRKDLTAWFALFLGLVCVSERLISKKRNQ